MTNPSLPIAPGPMQDAIHGPSAPNPRSPADAPQPVFPRAAGETPRAYSAFVTFFQLGHARSLFAVAQRLGEHLSTVKKWSSKFAWSQRVQDFNAGLLQQHACQQADLHRRHAAEWAERAQRLRDQEWHSAQKLAAAADSFLESFDEDAFRRVTLDQAARALGTASAMAHAALAGTALPDPAESGTSPLQQQLLAAVQRIYAAPAGNPVTSTVEPASRRS